MLAQASGLVHFRKRVTSEILSEINDLILASSAGDDGDDDRDDTRDPDGTNNQDGDDGTSTDVDNEGSLLMGASCAPAAIRYPTDLSLLNNAREMTEAVIDTCHAPDIGTNAPPDVSAEGAKTVSASGQEEETA